MVFSICLLVAPRVALADGAWYVDGAQGNDGNPCWGPGTSACRTIGGALRRAMDGETINIASGTYTENLVITRALTLQGAGPASTIVNGGGLGRVIYLNASAVTVTGLTLFDGNVPGHGAGVYVSGTAVLSDVVVTGGHATNGGGVYLEQGDLWLTHSVVQSNTATEDGGGVYVKEGTLTLSGGSVAGNHAAMSGGGLYLVAGSALVSGTTVASNTAVYGGGGAMQAGRLAVNSAQVVSNTAASDGGGIYTEGGSLQVSDTLLRGNTGRDGGGLFVASGQASLTDTLVLSNSAASDGGGLGASGGSVSVRDGLVLGNSAGMRGGGLMLSGDSPPGHEISGTSIVTNTAILGGGLHLMRGDLVLTGVQVMSNTASSDGGGLHVERGNVRLEAATIGRNRAANYGGGIFADQGTVTVSGTDIVSNTAASGGGAYVHDFSATLTQIGSSVIAGNAATATGGGLAVSQGLANLAGARVVGNAATVGGGIHVEDGTVNLLAAQLLSNTASTDGGAAYLANGALQINASCVSFNSDTAVGSQGAATVSAQGNWWGVANGPSGVAPGGGDSVSAGVQYAGFLATAPPNCPAIAADVVLSQIASEATVVPGQAVTFTVEFSNKGPGTARGLAIADVVPVTLTAVAVQSWGADGPVGDTAGISYIWGVERLVPGGRGGITVTGVVSPDLSTDALLTNIAQAGSLTPDSSRRNDSHQMAVMALMPRLAFSTGEYSVSEHGGAAVITITVGPALYVSATATVSAQGGTAAPALDYLPVSDTLSFGPATLAITFTVSITDDDLVEGNKTVDLVLANLSPAMVLGAPPTATLTILDDEWAIYLPLVLRAYP